MPSVKQVGEGWFKELESDFNSDWFKSIKGVVAQAYAAKRIRPEPTNIFRALRETQPDSVKVVMLGQDPYPGGGHADGLAFSSQQRETPKSLEIIYQDLERIYGSKPKTNDLTFWAKQGVLLLNTSLTVISGVPMSHHHIGWDKLIRSIFKVLSNKQGLVYVAWGGPAKEVVRGLLTPEQYKTNKVITGIHPIAQSYSQGKLQFNGRFDEINQYLKEQGKEPIQWI